jgi:membrane-associated PAP2 superfamily phosphatase
MPGAARGFALVGEDSALLAATASGAVSCHTWPLQPSASGFLLFCVYFAHTSDISMQSMVYSA